MATPWEEISYEMGGPPPPGFTQNPGHYYATEGTGDPIELNDVRCFDGSFPGPGGCPPVPVLNGGGPSAYPPPPPLAHNEVVPYLQAENMPTPWDQVSFEMGGPPPVGYRNVYQNQNQFSVTGAIAGVNCDTFPDGPLKIACKVAQGIASAAAAGGNRGQNQGENNLTSGPSSCPTGFVWDGKQCEASFGRNMGGPLVTSAGGMMGLGRTPDQVGTIRRKDGTTGPILRCTKGWILGIDYFCYPKAMLPKNLRAHPPGTKPLLTGGDVRILSKARSLEKKVKRLSSRYVRKACSCKAPRRGKK